MTRLNSTLPATANVSSGEDSSFFGETEMILLLLALLAIPIIVINCFVIVLVWKKEFLRTPANLCLSSLACTDLLTGVGAIPLVIVCTLTQSVWCLTMDLVNRLLAISAILHLLVIAVERYLVVVLHVRPDDFLSCKKYVVIVSAIWLISSCASLIQLSFLDWQGKVPHLDGVSQMEIIFDLVCIFGFVCAPLFIILTAYSRVFCVLRRHTRDIAKQASLFVSNSRQQKLKTKQKRATLIYASMIVFYIIGWFPYFLITLSVDLGGGTMVAEIPKWAYTIFLFTRFFSPLANPVLYTFFKQDFKTAILTMTGRRPQVQLEQVPSCPPLDANTLEMEDLRKGSSTTDSRHVNMNPGPQ